MTTLGERLTHEHKDLDALYEDLANRVHCGDTAAIDEAWGPLETRLRAHMDFEELQLLPRFELIAPDAARRIQAEHAQIRDALSDVGIAIELHTVREDAMNRLLSHLRAHGRHEEETLYRWRGVAAEELTEIQAEAR